MNTIWAGTNMTNIDNLVEQLGKLTVVEAGDLSKRLEEAWGLDLSALTSAPVQVPVVEEVKTTATVVLTAFADGKKIPVLQKVRKYKEMGMIFWGLMAWQLLLFVIIAMILVLIF